MSAHQPPPANARLVDELARRLRQVDLIGWTRIAAYAQETELSLEDLRLLLALAIEDRAMTPSELADLTGLPLDAVYPAIHRLRGRGYTREEQRRHSLAEAGRELVTTLDAAHRAGIQAYVEQLNPAERERLAAAFGVGG